jgi:hypothetical protein
VNCGGGGCPGEGGDCFIANGTPGCDDVECCEAVCAADPFCCDTAWDQLCADQAFALCGGNPACPGDGSCFFANGSPGCDDVACCNTVCAADPFCCDVEWDQLCADQANDLCGNAACPGAGSCFESNGTVGCDNASCCNLVCAIDPFCCETSWDGICADEADLFCTCPCDFDNDFDVDVDDLLTVLANWNGPGGDCTGDGLTNVDDLLAVLADWGACP